MTRFAHAKPDRLTPGLEFAACCWSIWGDPTAEPRG